MTTYSYSQLEGLWTSNGGSTSMAPVMAAIAMAESSGNPDARNPSGATGLWQIMPGWGKYSTTDPNLNAQGAVHILSVQGLTAWSTYTNGAYKKFLNSSSPITSTGSTGGTSGGTSATDSSWWNPSTWGGAIAGGIEQGMLSAMVAILKPLLQWFIWGAQIIIGLSLIATGIFVLLQKSNAVRSLEATALKAAVVA